MAFVFGATSKANLEGVAPPLVTVVTAALAVTKQDFGITCGVRTDAAQLAAWRDKDSDFNGIPKGESRGGIAGTGRGNHQIALTGTFAGLSTAVDAAPYVDGSISDDWRYFYEIAFAFRMAAIQEGVRIRWGGCWQVINDLPWTQASDAKAARDAYAEQRRKAKRKALLDGYHFELI